MKKTIQIGISDFKKVIENNHYFVDKSLLIKEFLEDGADVILTPRPRRFGKTLNLSMLRYFFDIELKEDTKSLFKGLKIEEEKEIMKLQGQYPVIFLTFKNQKNRNYEEFIDGIKILISNLYRDHDYLLTSDKLSEFEKIDFKEIALRKALIGDFAEAIGFLMKLMYKHYGKKVMLFIDEYDVPIQEGYIKGYYDDMISFIRIMLTSALKDNNYLEKAMITGILRVAKESIFSGLNNLQVNTLLNRNYNDKFGFTENDVYELVKYYDVNEKIDKIKQWYNGYVFGGKVIYNPWSVLNYIKNERDGLIPYWVNTSSNDLIKRILVKGNKDIKLDLEKLIEGESINKVVDDSIVMSEVEDSNENIWSFLLMSGYLKTIKTETIEGITNCQLKVPNKEVLVFYRRLIVKWFEESVKSDKYEDMLNALITGDIEIFAGLFKQFVINNISYFDVSGKEPERVYHAFVLGMLISLSKSHEVKSNKESGYGRYDVMIIPKDISKIGIIMEFKKIDDFLDLTIEQGCTAALKQIEDRKYETELIEKGISGIIKLAIVFKGKEIKIVQG